MSAPRVAPGTIIAGKYQVRNCIGHSGSAATYLAMSADGREVVLKMFDPAIRQRADIMGDIERTYAATNALPHDVAVPLLDAGYDTATLAPFSVSERILLPSLPQLVAQRPLSPEDAARLLELLAHLLDQAHARGFCHHALKPANIFVGFAQGQGVRVTDFGAGLARSAVPSQEGYALDMPWVSPEQVQGAPATVAADVFGAALVVFYALTGASYFRSCHGTLDVAAWQHELMGPRVPASVRAKELGIHLPPALDAVLGRALAVDPAGRYRSVGEFATLFEATVSAGGEAQATLVVPASALGLAVGAPPPSTPSPAAGQVPLRAPAPVAAPLVASTLLSAQPQIFPYGQPLPEAAAEGSLGETAAGRSVGSRNPPRRGGTKQLVPILVGLAVLLLLGGAAAAWVVMGKKGDSGASRGASTKPSADAVSSASATTAVPPASSVEAPPPAASEAAPTPSGSAAEVDAGPAAPEARFVCDPECDEIKCDDKPTELGKPVVLTPGKHVIVASKAGYLSVREVMTVKPGEAIEKQFKLFPKPAAPTSSGTAPATGSGKQPCGGFLKRCK